MVADHSSYTVTTYIKNTRRRKQKKREERKERRTRRKTKLNYNKLKKKKMLLSDFIEKRKCPRVKL